MQNTSNDRVQRKLILQLALWASCNQHLLARKKFFKSRMKKNLINYSFLNYTVS